MKQFKTIEQVQKALQKQNYITERSLATTIFLSLKMGKPMFLEGEAGVGKTEVAKVLAKILNTELIRLQCYEGLDVHNAVYEWNYTRQILQIRLLEATGHRDEKQILHEIFGPEFLIRRPLLQAVDGHIGQPPVLLIDELDRADEEFEAFLLELLSDFQITIPEIGTIKAQKPPVVVITSNRTREIHDALKRRCLYFWIDYPSAEKEFQIVMTKVPEIPKKLAHEIVAFVQELRTKDLYKLPGVAETLDWAQALMALTEQELHPEVVDHTLGTLLKYQDDIARIKGGESAQILEKIKQENETGT
ncbi:MAG: MoxR family ATPase [Calditrichaeota bacterium]|nr:MAG: MoxR family ATPase [Calditrichota bacterium]